ncbi:MAG: glycosyl hydrolase [Caldilineaceae bacterium]
MQAKISREFPKRKTYSALRALAKITGVVIVLFCCFRFTFSSSYAQSCTPYPSPQARFGFNVARDDDRHIDDYDIRPLQAHWYLDYMMEPAPSHQADILYAQMVRPKLWNQRSFTATAESTLQANPGALWLIGNEPDRDKQDGLTPAQYAVFYHDVYHFIKARDANSHVAIGAVVQSTPLRRRYLDMVLNEYQTRYGEPIPMDLWTVHAFILPENYVWGASIPPGLEAYASEGMQYTAFDHDNIEIFKQNLIDFRQWMNARGYRNKPLLVTEYGILLSPLHGFPYEKVRAFMVKSFDFFMTATDDTTGYPADGNRLIQSWSWFSLNYPPYDPATGEGHNGNLMTPDSAELLPLGVDYGNYITNIVGQEAVTLALQDLTVTPATVILTPTLTAAFAITTTPMPTFTVQAKLYNTGNVTGCKISIHLWHKDPQGKLTSVAQVEQPTLTASTGPDDFASVTFDWQPAALQPGLQEFLIEARAGNSDIGIPTAAVRQSYRFHVLTEPFSDFLFLPIIIE